MCRPQVQTPGQTDRPRFQAEVSREFTSVHLRLPAPESAVDGPLRIRNLSTDTPSHTYAPAPPPSTPLLYARQGHFKPTPHGLLRCS